MSNETCIIHVFLGCFPNKTLLWTKTWTATLYWLDTCRCGVELRALKTSSVCLLHIMLTSLTSVLLILLQTDSSPSMSLAQLTKVLFLLSYFCSKKNLFTYTYVYIYLGLVKELWFCHWLSLLCPNHVHQTANLVDANASEEDKIKAMMCQSNHDYDPIQSVFLITPL